MLITTTTTAAAASARRWKHSAPRSEGELTVTPIRILQMDCPTEEALIRKQLASMSEVVALEFRLMQRLLTVTHQRRTAGHSGRLA
jgi:hypothetical protein